MAKPGDEPRTTRLPSLSRRQRVQAAAVAAPATHVGRTPATAKSHARARATTGVLTTSYAKTFCTNTHNASAPVAFV